MTMDAPIQSRRNPGALSTEEMNRQSFGRFCADLERCKALYPTQRRVARLIALATLKQGVRSIALRSLDEFTRLNDGRAFAGLGAPDISLAVNGGSRRVNGDPVLVQGLKHFGILQVDDRSNMEAAMPLTVWLVIVDSSQWNLPPDGWFNSEADESQWLMHVRALLRRNTPQLPVLASEADLHDARACMSAETSVRLGRRGELPRSIMDAPVMPAETNVAEGRNVRRPRHERSGAPCRSESRNAKRPANAESVPKVGTLPVKQFNSLKQITVQQLNSFKTGDVNRLLRLLEAQFARADGVEAARKEMINSGGNWRNIARTWPDEFEVQIGELRNFMACGGKFSRSARNYFQFYFRRAIGMKSWEEVCSFAKRTRNLLK